MLYLCISKISLPGKGEGVPVPFTFVKWGWFTFVKRKFFLKVKAVGSFIIADANIKKPTSQMKKQKPYHRYKNYITGKKQTTSLI